MVAFQLPWAPERLVARLLPGTLRASGLDVATADRYAARFRDPRALRGPLNWYRGIPFGVERDVPRPDPVVRVPTTFVRGSRDDFLGPEAARKTADFVAADYSFVEVDASHWLPESEPETVAAAILDRVSGASP